MQGETTVCSSSRRREKGERARPLLHVMLMRISPTARTEQSGCPIRAQSGDWCQRPSAERQACRPQWPQYLAHAHMSAHSSTIVRCTDLHLLACLWVRLTLVEPSTSPDACRHCQSFWHAPEHGPMPRPPRGFQCRGIPGTWPTAAVQPAAAGSTPRRAAASGAGSSCLRAVRFCSCLRCVRNAET
jgi:hypothetical protein